MTDTHMRWVCLLQRDFRGGRESAGIECFYRSLEKCRLQSTEWSVGPVQSVRVFPTLLDHFDRLAGSFGKLWRLNLSLVVLLQHLATQRLVMAPITGVLSSYCQIFAKYAENCHYFLYSRRTYGSPCDVIMRRLLKCLSFRRTVPEVIDFRPFASVLNIF